MGIGIFDRLNFPASMANNTVTFSENTQRSLANLPPILTTWQMEDIANSNTYGYFVNPVSDYANTINSTMLSIETTANGCNLFSVSTVANEINVSNTVVNFLNHTNRISGVTPFDANTVTGDLPPPPFYDNCIGIGKALTYLVYQSDGISNNAVLMGNFGSLYTANTLISHSANLANDLILIQNSISDGNSNLSAEQITTIISDMNSMNTFVYNSVTQDVTFYNNSNAIMEDYNKVKGFTRPGDTEKYLYEIIASDKLKERI